MQRRGEKRRGEATRYRLPTKPGSTYTRRQFNHLQMQANSEATLQRTGTVKKPSVKFKTNFLHQQ